MPGGRCRLKINGRTKIAGIFGDPVDHTVSPAMHNAAFEALGLDMVYVPFHVRSKPVYELKRAVESIRALNLKGVNVTIPHKERVLKYLDEIDEHAREVGAVNSIVNRNGKLTGYNTDGPGYLLSLKKETGFTPKGKNIIVLGAGGAARSILYSILDKNPRSVVIANRTSRRAEDLSTEFMEKFPVEIHAVKLEKRSIGPYMEKAGLLVNTTSIGMKGNGSFDLPFESLPGDAVVSDIVYVPLDTALLKAAKARRLKTHHGLSMLVGQGAITFELWTGKKAPVDIMRGSAMRALGLK
ncbi:MAG: shikimate dehydrogenase [Deltaproteobacteria bacterium]|nr:shikimate dehydrogenase [Deltaproteobacteria bacterium]